MDFARRWRCGVDAGPASAMRSSSPDRRLCPTTDAKLAKDSFDVHLDSGLCDINLPRDGLDRLSFNKAAQNQVLWSRKLRHDLVNGKDWLVVVRSALFVAKNIRH